MDRSKLLKEFGFEEEYQEVVSGMVKGTGFPNPEKSYHLIWEVFDLSLEEPYFWTLDVLKNSMPLIEKLEDSFAAAENSAFFGITQQRLGAQQDKISQFLATIGKMIKELFQMVRELRILDERMGYYDSVEAEFKKPVAERKKNDEITLKGIFVDLVQGGGKSAASIYGMARELEFITLPDLFFDAPPFKDDEELNAHVRSLEADFNQQVIRVLIRHLNQYLRWRQETAREHRNRKRFMLSYLLQHFDIIKMYITWIKPYLKYAERLTLKGERMSSPDLITAFEGSMLDIELLARDYNEKLGVSGCVLVTFQYRTRPELKVVQEGYQRGPVHIGKFEMNVRVYGWTDEQVEKYKKLKEKEYLNLIGDVSKTVQEAMNSLGADLDHYLDEARGKTKKDEEKKEEISEKKSLFEKVFGDFYMPSAKKSQKTVEKSLSARGEKILEAKKEVALKSLVGKAKGVAWGVSNNFKKAHRMLTW